MPRECVVIEKIIGKGAFGQVAKATVENLRGTRGKETVAVKMLKGEYSCKLHWAFISTVITGLRYSSLFLFRKRTCFGQERFAFRTGNHESASGSSARDQAVGMRHYGRWELISCNYNITQATISHIQSEYIPLVLKWAYLTKTRILLKRSKTFSELFEALLLSCQAQTFQVARINSSLRCNIA